MYSVFHYDTKVREIRESMYTKLNSKVCLIQDGAQNGKQR